MTAPWVRDSAAGAVLTLHVQPGAKRSEVAGLHGDALKIRLAAPPVDGKANACLLEFLATRLKVARARLQLVAGQTARSKRILIAGISALDVQARLLSD